MVHFSLWCFTYKSDEIAPDFLWLLVQQSAQEMESQCVTYWSDFMVSRKLNGINNPSCTHSTPHTNLSMAHHVLTWHFLQNKCETEVFLFDLHHTVCES